jgi:hypothetical protein
MRSNHACLACCVFLFAAGPVALIHCSSSSNTNNSGSHGDASSQGSSNGGNSSNGAGSSSGGGTEDGGPSGSSSGITTSSSGGGTSSSGGGEGGTSSGDGGASSSGGHTTPVPEGGVASDPGVVPCGTSTCTTSTNYCCVSGGDGGTQSCVAYNGGTCGTGSFKIGCNESADCMSGVCCQTILGIAMVGSTSCMPSCTYGPTQTTYYQTCRTDAECGVNSDAGAAAAKCIPQTCTAPNQFGGGPSIDIEACAYFTRGTGGGPGTWGPLPYCVAK